MLHNITLEVSLKPFANTDFRDIDGVSRRIFTQWKPLCLDVPCVSVLMWTADGSELLEYRGSMTDAFEWAMYIGGANNREGNHSAIDPEGLGLHSRCYLYRENPPTATYAILRQIVASIHTIGKEILGKDREIRVGTTFDPGPEFAKSSFKYSRHNEICMGNDMGKGTMVCSYATLRGDDTAYAAYPHGIPEGLPFGTFFGAQTQCFLKDMGFDYIWFSNGLGFGRETWTATGATFDGESFHTGKLAGVRKDVSDFWGLFREMCPDYPIETRGTNMSAGIDYATDGVPLRDIYDGNYNLLPPPNSPWAAINHDFGLELMGYMSRIAGLPEDDKPMRHPYLFRFYIHDIWWANSPWYDRYNSQPHDIYLPLSIARLDPFGKVEKPTHMSLLSIDNCFGDMPDHCAIEPTVHLQKAIKDAPDDVAPVVWVYPFDEYITAQTGEELADMYAGDWFIRGAIANGAAISMVTSTASFCGHDRELYKNSILVTPVPKAGSAFEEKILSYGKSGGKVIFYGNTTRASVAFLSLFGLDTSESSADGILSLTIEGHAAGEIKVTPVINGGAVSGKIDKTDDTDLWAEAGGYPLAVQRGSVQWLRGLVSCDYRKGARAPIPQDMTKFFPSESLLAMAIGRFGLELRQEKKTAAKPSVYMLHKHNGSLMFSVFSPNTTVKTYMKFPQGAPILDGYETELEGGYATYHFPRAEHRECRVFVEQESGTVGCREIPPVSAQYRRRVEVNGLENGTVRFYPETYCGGDIQVLLNSHTDFYFVGQPFDGNWVEDGGYFEVRGVTGNVTFSMPFPPEKMPPQGMPGEIY